MPSSKVIYRQQLCWECKNADGSGDCPWVNKFKPVEGWKANKVVRYNLETTRKNKKVIRRFRRKLTSYEIIECPLFKPDRKRKKKG